MNRNRSSAMHDDHKETKKKTSKSKNTSSSPDGDDGREYTDYSCSTSLERLARDVQTVLHTWHVDKGSDRHFSSAGDDGRHDAPLRSAPLTWNVNFYYHQDDDNDQQQQQRVDCDLELQMILWDGPPPSASSPADNNNRMDDGTMSDYARGGDNEHHHAQQQLPFSVRRRPVTTTAEDDDDNGMIDNFSKLFGIGQHITLTPVKPDDISQSLLDYLTLSIQHRHDPSSIAAAPQAVLTGWLQTALNLAASHCDCQFPVLGLWGRYVAGVSTSFEPHHRSSSTTTLKVIPDWAATTVSYNDAKRKRGNHIENQYNQERNQNNAPPVLTGQMQSERGTCALWCCVLPYNKEWNTTNNNNKSWTVWGDVLLQQCRDDDESMMMLDPTTSQPFVHLWKARHTFLWSKQRPQRSLLWEAFGGGSRQDSSSEWREPTVQAWKKPPPPPFAPDGCSSSRSSAVIDLTNEDSLDQYRKQCQRYALRLLEQATCASDSDPMWGPADDPVESIHTVLTWTGGTAQDDNNGTLAQEPLLTLPLEMNSRQTMSKEDVEEMEVATESVILDLHRPSKSILKVYYDASVAHATQAATQRCVLAALIRTATLPKETLLSHLIDETLIDRWDRDAGNRIAGILSKKAHVDHNTRSLVAAMDWTHAADDMIERWEAEDIVRKVFNGSPVLGFPSPPDNVVASVIEKYLSDGSGGSNSGWEPLFKAAPPGRLVSLLFVHMARVRSPPSMALVWIMFVQELRRRWDARESLPNMNYVPGLDPPPHISGNNMRRCFSNVGARANLSAQVNSSEPEPDDFHCLIGQKLQVFNLGLESVISSEMRGVEQMEKRPRVEAMDTDAPSPSAKASKTLFNGSIVDGVPLVDGLPQDIEQRESQRGSQMSPDFYSAEEDGGSLLSNPSLKFLSTTVSSQLPPRRGARCPVQGATLIESGDQLYAPYLQRPYPLTDDVIAEHRLVLGRQDSGQLGTNTIQQRLEVAQRLIKPKLQSDMSCFKAANPGAIFQDFISWYGNPTDPFADNSDEVNVGDTAASAKQVAAKKLDRAAEALRALEQMRVFWSKTWDEAEALPADDQDPLFDAESTVEMALDYLENIHPATLLCQVVATNLSMSYFTLAASAGETANIPTVTRSLRRLREHVELALQLLSMDVTMSIGSLPHAVKPTLNGDGQDEKGSLDMMSSVEAIAASAKACEVLAQTELILSRAASLLQKLPQRYDVVETIMKSKENDSVNIRVGAGLSTILRTIHEQQKRLPSAGTDLTLKPALREYILRNMDDYNPCQLCVRYSDGGMNTNGNPDTGGLLLALSKVVRY